MNYDTPTSHLAFSHSISRVFGTHRGAIKTASAVLGVSYQSLMHMCHGRQSIPRELFDEVQALPNYEEPTEDKYALQNIKGDVRVSIYIPAETVARIDALVAPQGKELNAETADQILLGLIDTALNLVDDAEQHPLS